MVVQGSRGFRRLPWTECGAPVPLEWGALKTVMSSWYMAYLHIFTTWTCVGGVHSINTPRGSCFSQSYSFEFQQKPSMALSPAAQPAALLPASKSHQSPLPTLVLVFLITRELREESPHLLSGTESLPSYLSRPYLEGHSQDTCLAISTIGILA